MTVKPLGRDIEEHLNDWSSDKSQDEAHIWFNKLLELRHVDPQPWNDLWNYSIEVPQIIDCLQCIANDIDSPKLITEDLRRNKCHALRRLWSSSFVCAVTIIRNVYDHKYGDMLRVIKPVRGLNTWDMRTLSFSFDLRVDYWRIPKGSEISDNNYEKLIKLVKMSGFKRNKITRGFEIKQMIQFAQIFGFGIKDYKYWSDPFESKLQTRRSTFGVSECNPGCGTDSNSGSRRSSKTPSIDAEDSGDAKDLEGQQSSNIVNSDEALDENSERQQVSNVKKLTAASEQALIENFSSVSSQSGDGEIESIEDNHHGGMIEDQKTICLLPDHTLKNQENIKPDSIRLADDHKQLKGILMRTAESEIEKLEKDAEAHLQRLAFVATKLCWNRLYTLDRLSHELILASKSATFACERLTDNNDSYPLKRDITKRWSPHERPNIRIRWSYSYYTNIRLADAFVRELDIIDEFLCDVEPVLDSFRLISLDAMDLTRILYYWCRQSYLYHVLKYVKPNVLPLIARSRQSMRYSGTCLTVYPCPDCSCALIARRNRNSISVRCTGCSRKTEFKSISSRDKIRAIDIQCQVWCVGVHSIAFP